MSDLDCKMLLLTQADFDGELDAAQAAELAVHRDGCAACQDAQAALAQVRDAMRDEPVYAAAPAALRHAIVAQTAAITTPVAAPPVRRLSWWQPGPFGGFAAGAALATALMFVVLQPGPPDMIDRVIDDHARALQPGHLEDVVSTDRHTVKPWFEGRIDFAPPVKDLAARQFPLIGGRLDVLGGRTVAALVYRHGAHPIDLLVWPAGSSDIVAPTAASRQGFTAVHWIEGGMTFWAVSDIDRAQLEEFVRLWRAAA